MPVLRLSLAALAIAALAPIIDASPASAQTNICRPWCVQYGGVLDGATNCGFISYEQCLRTADGLGFCMPNGFCPPSYNRTRERARRR